MRNPSNSKLRPRLIPALLAALLLPPLACQAGAGIRTDGSVGTGGWANTPTTIAGANAGAGVYVVPQAAGTLAGNNLFHSFTTFNIDTGQTANFTTTTNTITNVISRVTGGSASQIYGTLKLTAAAGSSPNFFFINPAGITFGAGAVVDVPASFHVSTADYISFGNGQPNFPATGPVSLFASVDPVAFGFLGTNRASINFDTNKLSLKEPVQPVQPDPPAPPVPQLPLFTFSVVASDIAMTNGGGIDSPATNVNVVALGLKQAEVSIADPSSTIGGGRLDISNGSQIAANSSSNNNGGNILIRAGSIAVDGQGTDSGIFDYAKADTQSKAGNIDIAASSISLLNRGWIDSSTEDRGDNAGNITISANSLTIDGAGNAGGIVSNARFGSLGSAGSISISVANDMSVLRGAVVDTSTFYDHNAGTINIHAGSLTLDMKGTQANTGIGSQAASGSIGGNAGDVVIRVDGKLSIRNGAGIDSSTYGQGDAGTVDISAGSVLVDGSGYIRDQLDNLIFSPSSIAAYADVTSTSARTGDVTVIANDSITLSNKGKISIQNDGTLIGAPRLTKLTIQAPRITLIDAKITSAATGTNDASSIKIKFSDKLYLDPSEISTSANAGNGGAIDIAGGSGALVLDNSQITTSTDSANGGNISIAAKTVIMNTGFILANSATGPNAGAILIDSQMLVPSGNTLFKGTTETLYNFSPGVFGYNVIQSTAPMGQSNVPDVKAPALDVSGALVGLATQMLDTGGLGRSPCQVTAGSSMVQSGRGGFAPSARGLLGPVGAAAAAKSAAVPFLAGDLRLAFGAQGCSGS